MNEQRVRVPLIVIFLFCMGAFASPQEDDEQAEPETRQEILLRARREKAESLEPERVSTWEARLRGWEKAKFPTNWLVKGWRGFRPVIGGMPSGSGTVFGGGYIHGLENQYFQFQANARFSTKTYTAFDAEVVFPPPNAGRRIELRAKGEARNLKSLRFFGLGNDSSDEDLSTYYLEDTGVRGFLWLNPRGLLSFGANGGYYRADTRSGIDAPSVEDFFPEEEIPGFGFLTNYGIVGGWAEFDIRDKWEDPPLGIVFRISGERYEDLDHNRFAFTQYVGDLKAYIPLPYRSRILALRVRTSQSEPDDEDSVIPFYLMETLGGARTIRGYSEWRFRDTRNLLVNAEYRWEVWTFLDFAFFFDAGKVFSDPSDFNFKDMHTGYGFGLRFHGLGETFVFRTDLAFSAEGWVLHIGSGPTF